MAAVVNAARTAFNDEATDRKSPHHELKLITFRAGPSRWPPASRRARRCVEPDGRFSYLHQLHRKLSSTGHGRELISQILRAVSRLTTRSADLITDVALVPNDVTVLANGVRELRVAVGDVVPDP